MLDDFIVVSEVDKGRDFAEAVFQRKFRLSVPGFPHHVVTFYRKSWDCLVPLSYVHIRPRGDIYLVGGACTDGRVFAMMTDKQRERISAAGGVYLNALRYAFDHFGDRCEAFFGYCGDARAWDVDMQAGFVATAHEMLIARWHKPVEPARQLELVEQARGWIPF